MAPGPDRDDDRAAERSYQAAWRATMKAVKGGDSFSGHERNMAFLNRPAPEVPGGRGFADVSAIAGLDFPDDGRAVAAVDWDRDGDLDLWFRNRSAPALRLMINQLGEEDEARSFVAIRLEGVASNRDGIGARVEVTLGDGSVLVRSLAAGSGFLSQSSKWLHFGLGEGATIRSVVVQWPWGKRESFSGVDPGGWWALVEGGGTARRLAIERQALPLEPGPQELPVLDSSRTLLSAGVPAPAVTYRTPERDSEILGTGNGTRLVLFWASWCPHCRTELAALAASAGELRTAGVEVLALNVDGVIEGPPTDEAERRAVLAASGFPFRWGVDEGLALPKLKHLEHALLDRDTELSVPYSCLLNAQGEVQAFYRGPLQVAQVVRDAVHLADSPDRRRAAGAGFGGLTFSSAGSTRGLLVDIGIEFQERFPLEALRYLKMALPESSTDPEHDPVRRRIAALHYVLGLEALNAREASTAAAHFQHCITFRPDLMDARLNLSVALFRQGQAARAKEVLEDLLALDPNHAGARANLKMIEERLRNSR